MAALGLAASSLATVAAGPASAVPECAGSGQIAFNPGTPTPLNSGQFTFDAPTVVCDDGIRDMEMTGQWTGTAFGADLEDDTGCEVSITGTVAAGVFTGSTTYTCTGGGGAGTVDFADGYIRISF